LAFNQFSNCTKYDSQIFHKNWKVLTELDFLSRMLFEEDIQ